MPLNGDELIPTHASLLTRLKDWQAHSAWQEFFNTYWKLIYGVARKGGLTEAEAQDVVLETMESVARHMPTFKYDPARSFKTWLLNKTRWLITDQLRKRQLLLADRRLSNGTTTGTDVTDKVADPTIPSLDELWETEWQKNTLEKASANVRRRAHPQKFQIFDCCVNKEWPPEKVAEYFGVTVDQVYLDKHRVIKMIKEEAERLEKETT